MIIMKEKDILICSVCCTEITEYASKCLDCGEIVHENCWYPHVVEDHCDISYESMMEDSDGEWMTTEDWMNKQKGL